MRTRLYGLRRMYSIYRICAYIRMITRFCQPLYYYTNIWAAENLVCSTYFRRATYNTKRVSELYTKAGACDYKQPPGAQSRILSYETSGFSKCRTMVSLPGACLPVLTRRSGIACVLSTKFI